MNIYLPLSGRAKIVVPEPVYQGSVGVGTVTVQSPLPRTTALELWFELPDERSTKVGPYVMALVTPSSGVDGINYWTATLDHSVTIFSGTVSMVINAISVTGQNLTTYACDFEVQKGILPGIPPNPDSGAWQQLLILLQANTVSIELLWSELEILGANIDDLDIDGLRQALEDLERIKEEMQEQLDELGGYKVELFAMIADLENRLLTRIASLEVRMHSQESSMNAMQWAVQGLQNQLPLVRQATELNHAAITSLWNDQQRQDGDISANRYRLNGHEDELAAIIDTIATLTPTQRVWQDDLDSGETWQEALNSGLSWWEAWIGVGKIADIWAQITALWQAENTLENKVNANILIAKHYHKAFTNATFSGEVWIKEFTHNPDVASVSIWGYATETAVGTTGQAFAILDPSTYPLLNRFIDQVDQWARGYNSSTGVFSDMPVRITAANGIEIVTPPNIPIGTRFTWQFVLYLSDESEVIEL